MLKTFRMWETRELVFGSDDRAFTSSNYPADNVSMIPSSKGCLESMLRAISILCVLGSLVPIYLEKIRGGIGLQA